MTYLLDVNLLIALLWHNHEHFHSARGWFSGVTAFATCPLVQLGFARISAHPTLGYGMSPDHAFSTLRNLIADARHRFIPDDIGCSDRSLRTDLMRGPNDVTDRYLASLARQHGVSLATFDETWQENLPESAIW